MTTIAANRKSMAGDTLVDDEGTIYYSDKVFRIRGELVGVAGSSQYTTKFLEWFRQECPATTMMSDGVADEDYDFAALVVNEQGIFRYNDLCEPDLIHGRFAAIGIGSLAALVAMDKGDTAGQAVRAVMKHATHTGGKVTELHLIKKEKESRHKATRSAGGASSDKRPQVDRQSTGAPPPEIGLPESSDAHTPKEKQ